MTRHRRGDADGEEGDAPWRARDYESAARQSGSGPEYFPAAWEDPAGGAHQTARGALGTSSEDTGPGEVTGPPWELPGWDDSQPVRRAPRPGGLSGGHPSGPLPRVSSSGPLPRVSPDSWPGATTGPMPAASSRPPAPLPHDGEGWADQAGGDYPTGGYGGGHSGGSAYPPDPYLDGDGSGYEGGGRGDYPGSRDDAPYLRTGLPDTGYGGGHDTGPGYPGTDSGYLESGFGDQAPDGYEHDGYPDEAGYASEPGYSDEGFGAEDYADEPGYPAQQGYPPGTGYQAGEDYPAGDDYGHDSGFPGHTAYPGDHDAAYAGDHDAGYASGEDTGYHDRDAGYPDDQYQRGPGGQRGATRGRPGDHEDDRGYADPGGWYGDVDDDESWAEDGDYEDGFLPGITRGTDTRRAGAPGPERGYRPGAGSGRSRGGGGGGGGGGKARPRKSPMRRAAPWIALSVVVVTLLVLGGVGYYFYRTYVHPPDYSGPGTGEVTVHISSGETATDVGQQLLKLGVVASVRAFSNAAKNSGKGTSLETGYYRLHKHMAAALAFAMLLKPSSRVQLTIFIPPGLRLYELIDLLGKDTGNLKGYQAAIKDTSQLGLPSYAKGDPQGYLFPDTYTVQPGTSPIEVLRMMVARFNQEVGTLDIAKVAAKDQVSETDIIITASLIQAEGKRPQDLPKIARVVYNRLNDKMPLELDSTVLYALHSRAADVTIPQTHTKSPYNTYLHQGLPPGPIDSPTLASIQAALHPTKGDWTYFLTVNPVSGDTKFTTSYSVFLGYVQELDAYLSKHHH
jgi:UPF0755 protein